jgi:SPX domain protein involved in polyphosphate accumulation
MVTPYLDVDKFARNSDKNQYTVRSVYFDTPQFECYFDKINGIKNRKKLRLRGYNEEHPDNEVFLEIKRKYEIPIVKYRANLKYSDSLDLFKNSHINGYVKQSDKYISSPENAQRFFFQIYSKNMHPVVLITYEREAYQSKFDPTVRITFDKNLRSKSYPTLNELYTENDLNRSLQAHFILEVKFNNHFPYWMNPIISSLGLVRRAASKYVICMDTNKTVSNRLTKSSIYTRSKGPLNKI